MGAPLSESWRQPYVEAQSRPFRHCCCCCCCWGVPLLNYSLYTTGPAVSPKTASSSRSSIIIPSSSSSTLVVVYCELGGLTTAHGLCLSSLFCRIIEIPFYAHTSWQFVVWASSSICHWLAFKYIYIYSNGSNNCRCAPAQSTAINHSVSYQKLRKKKTGDFLFPFLERIK